MHPLTLGGGLAALCGLGMVFYYPTNNTNFWLGFILILIGGAVGYFGRFLEEKGVK